MKEIALQILNGSKVMAPVVYERGSFVVNESMDSNTYDVTHIGTGLSALRFLKKQIAIKLCNELDEAGAAGETMKELVNSPGWAKAYQIVERYKTASRKKPKRK